MPRSALLAAAKRAKITEAAADLLRLVDGESSSAALGHNLRLVGPDGTRNALGHLTDDAAHLVPKTEARYESARWSREILERFGIHVDEPINGTWLPHGRNTAKYPNPHGKSPHQPTHREAYYNALYNRLKGCRTEQEVLDVLDFVRGKLNEGIWP
ncbi:AHH domain-containing protein [Actinopolymorpha pittospori]